MIKRNVKMERILLPYLLELVGAQDLIITVTFGAKAGLGLLLGLPLRGTV